MVHYSSDEERFFHTARAIADDRSRNEYLDQVCADDKGLRERVEALLETYDDEPDFLASNLAETETAERVPVNQSDGQMIGPYKLLHLLGEGGMGSVWLAEQQRPVKRRVAIKLIKQGLDRQEFIARFEAERQALAMMDHPNIAKVLDAGCSENGRNYFVMEYVKGIPITQFCDDNRLNTEQRLKLFIQVCQAVQHAHQKGVIHRDLKPSNVMVAMYDDQPVPKVIDFGVAKATHQPLTEPTLCTIPGQIVGTWEYMSPEQAILNQLDVDTRTDIYSLGVILYELLTGKTPLDLKSLKPEMLEERLRRIREQEPARPSNRVSSLGEAAAATAAYRDTEANSLSKKLRGDLDTIVMKALEKDRSHRYETANGFASEIGRFLNDEPLTVRPPTTGQRIARMYRRNKLLVSTSTAVVAALTIGLVIALVAIAKLKIAENKTAELLEDHLESLTDVGLQYAFSGNLSDTERTARKIEEVNERLRNKREQARPDTLRGLAYFWAGDVTKARQRLEAANRQYPDSIATKAILAVTYSMGNEFDEYFELGDEVMDRRDDAELDDFDRLFIGSVQVLRDSSTAVNELNEVVKSKKNWAVARGTYADALAHNARAYQDPKLAFDAIEQMDRAQQIAPDVPYLKMADVFIHNVALSLTQRDSPRYNRLIEEARRMIAFLKKEHPDYPISRVIENWFYLNFSDDSAEKEESCWLVLETDVYPWAGTAYLMQQSDRGRLYSLLESKNHIRAPYAPTSLAMAKLYSDEADREQMVKKMTDLLFEDDFQMEGKVAVLEILALVGDENLAAKSKELEKSSNLRDFECFTFASVARLCREDLKSFQEFERYIDKGQQQGMYRKSYLAYVAGLMLLGHGNESDALKCFEQCIAQNQINSPAFYFSRAFINKLKLKGNPDSVPQSVNKHDAGQSSLNRRPGSFFVFGHAQRRVDYPKLN